MIKKWVVGLNPVRIIEGPTGDPAVGGKHFSGPGHGRSTGWTKFEPEPAVSFVRAELMGFEYTAGYLDDGFVKVCRYRKRTPVNRLQ